MPVRFQVRRTKGWRMPPNSVRCCRPGPYGNPFRIGGWFRMGDPNPRAVLKMSYVESLRGEEPGFTKIEDAAMAVAWFRRYAEGWNPEYRARICRELGGKDLGCFCGLDQPCHVDVLLEVANP